MGEKSRWSGFGSELRGGTQPMAMTELCSIFVHGLAVTALYCAFVVVEMEHWVQCMTVL